MLGVNIRGMGIICQYVHNMCYILDYMGYIIQSIGEAEIKVSGLFQRLARKLMSTIHIIHYYIIIREIIPKSGGQRSGVALIQRVKYFDNLPIKIYIYIDK